VLGQAKSTEVNITLDETLTETINGCIKGDRSSQRQLYEHFYSYGMSISLRYSKNEDEAIEILNDGFMKVFTKIDKYDKEKSFKGWLRKILINTALDNYRKNLKFYNHKPIEGLKQEDGRNVENDLNYEDIVRVIRELSPAYKLVFNLYVMDGYTHEEIADMLGISVGTSKSNLSKARANLREMLSKTYKDEYAKHTGS
jgi:RNA polymerase sigma factor (sigma-70 family)